MPAFVAAGGRGDAGQGSTPCWETSPYAPNSPPPGTGKVVPGTIWCQWRGPWPSGCTGADGHPAFSFGWGQDYQQVASFLCQAHMAPSAHRADSAQAVAVGQEPVRFPLSPTVCNRSKLQGPVAVARLAATWLGWLGSCGGGQRGGLLPYPPCPAPWPEELALPFGATVGFLPPSFRATRLAGVERSMPPTSPPLTRRALNPVPGQPQLLPTWAGLLAGAEEQLAVPGMSPGLPPHNAIAPNPPHPGGPAWAVQPLRTRPFARRLRAGHCCPLLALVGRGERASCSPAQRRWCPPMAGLAGMQSLACHEMPTECQMQPRHWHRSETKPTAICLKTFLDLRGITTYQQMRPQLICGRHCGSLRMGTRV